MRKFTFNIGKNQQEYISGEEPSYMVTCPYCGKLHQAFNVWTEHNGFLTFLDQFSVAWCNSLNQYVQLSKTQKRT